MRSAWLRQALLIALFAVAFGYVESAVVVYLRALYDPLRASSDSLLPLLTLDELRAAGEGHVRRLGIELGRELATIVMLGAAAAVGARRRGDGIALFLIAFGVWDLAYYAGLKAMIGFPASWLTWDILFLIPVPWLGPVLAPMIVALTMIAAGLVVLSRREPLRARWIHWAGIAAGALVIVASFCAQAPRTLAGEMPRSFDWRIFACGEAIGILAFLHALRGGGAARS